MQRKVTQQELEQIKVGHCSSHHIPNIQFPVSYQVLYQVLKLILILFKLLKYSLSYRVSYTRSTFLILLVILLAEPKPVHTKSNMGNNTMNTLYFQLRFTYLHCVKSIQIRSFFWSVFSRIRTEHGTRKNSVSGHISHSWSYLKEQGKFSLKTQIF